MKYLEVLKNIVVIYSLKIWKSQIFLKNIQKYVFWDLNIILCELSGRVGIADKRSAWTLHACMGTSAVYLVEAYHSACEVGATYVYGVRRRMYVRIKVPKMYVFEESFNWSKIYFFCSWH